jgi:amino acid transporter
VRVGLLGIFSLTVLIYAFEHGLHGYAASAFSPFHMAALLGLAPVLLFNYVGFELENGAAEEMKDPQRDVPATVLRSCLITALAYAIPVFGIVAVLPARKVTGISGFLAAVGQTFTVYGSAGHFLTQVMAIGFIIALVTSGSVWIMGSDRILAVAAYDGALPSYFGHFHQRLGTPVCVNVMSGIVATIFCGAATQLLAGGQANTFLVVLLLATSATLLGYLLVFPPVPILRRKFASIHRPYRVPGGNVGLWTCTARCMFWIVLGSWVALFPGTLNHLFGESYNIQATFGVSTARFEAFTLGTLAVIILVGVLGYGLAAPARRQHTVEIPIQGAPETTVMSQQARVAAVT